MNLTSEICRFVGVYKRASERTSAAAARLAYLQKCRLRVAGESKRQKRTLEVICELQFDAVKIKRQTREQRAIAARCRRLLTKM